MEDGLDNVRDEIKEKDNVRDEIMKRDEALKNDIVRRNEMARMCEQKYSINYVFDVSFFISTYGFKDDLGEIVLTRPDKEVISKFLHTIVQNIRKESFFQPYMRESNIRFSFDKKEIYTRGFHGVDEYRESTESSYYDKKQVIIYVRGLTENDVHLFKDKLLSLVDLATVEDNEVRHYQIRVKDHHFTRTFW